jgi:hypothetical protein
MDSLTIGTPIVLFVFFISDSMGKETELVSDP